MMSTKLRRNDAVVATHHAVAAISANYLTTVVLASSTEFNTRRNCSMTIYFLLPFRLLSFQSAQFAFTLFNERHFNNIFPRQLK